MFGFLFSDKNQATFWNVLAVCFILFSAYYTQSYLNAAGIVSIFNFQGFNISLSVVLSIITSIITTSFGLILRDFSKAKQLISSGKSSDNKWVNFFCGSFVLIGAFAFLAVFYSLDFISTAQGLSQAGFNRSFPGLSFLSWRDVIAFLSVLGSDFCVVLANAFGGGSKGGARAGGAKEGASPQRSSPRTRG